MTARMLEVGSVVFASLVAAAASVIALFTLWELQAQNNYLVTQLDHSEKQLALIEEQSTTLEKQLSVNEQLISNDSALTILQLLERMRPDWDLEVAAVGVGGEPNFEEYDPDTLVTLVNVTNNGPAPLVISRFNSLGMRSCDTGLVVDIGDSDRPVAVEAEGETSAQSRLLARVATIQPGDSEDIWFHKDTREEPKLAEALHGSRGTYLLDLSALVYAEGAEILRSHVDYMDELEGYFGKITDNGETLHAPFLAKWVGFYTWVTQDGSGLIHSDEVENCTRERLDELVSRFDR